jgi:hypothetical protein
MPAYGKVILNILAFGLMQSMFTGQWVIMFGAMGWSLGILIAQEFFPSKSG